MNWKALFEFGGKRQANQSPFIGFLIGFALLFVAIPWLVLDGEFLLKVIKFRQVEKLLTVENEPIFFYVVIVFCIIAAFFSLYGAISGYRQNVASKNLNKRL